MQHNYKADIIRLERLLDNTLAAQRSPQYQPASRTPGETQTFTAVQTASGACQFVSHNP